LHCTASNNVIYKIKMLKFSTCGLWTDA